MPYPSARAAAHNPWLVWIRSAHPSAVGTSSPTCAPCSATRCQAVHAVRRASNARVEGATPLSMFWSSTQPPCVFVKVGSSYLTTMNKSHAVKPKGPIAIEKMPTVRNVTPRAGFSAAWRGRFPHRSTARQPQPLRSRCVPKVRVRRAEEDIHHQL